MESGEAPVDTVEAKMLGQPVLELVFSLSVYEQLPPGWVARDSQCRGFECT